jgi:protein-disulfide isomerase
MRAPSIDAQVEANFREAEAKGFTGTPTFELNGEKMEYRSFDDWRNAIIAAIGGPVGSSTVDTTSDVEFAI